MQRQYVETFISLLVVLTSRDLQNGHASGATVAAVDSGEVYTCRALSAQWIASSTEPLFHHPLMADGSEVDNLMAPQPRRREHDDGTRNANEEDDPVGIHDRRAVPAN